MRKFSTLIFGLSGAVSSMFAAGLTGAQAGERGGTRSPSTQSPSKHDAEVIGMVNMSQSWGLVSTNKGRVPGRSNRAVTSTIKSNSK
jgi:hypothetical protein